MEKGLMAVPAMMTAIKDRYCWTKPEPKDYEDEMADNDKEETSYIAMKGRVKVDFAPNTKIDPNIIKLQILEMKIDEILSHTELTHLQLWNELKTLKDVLSDAEEKPPSQNT